MSFPESNRNDLSFPEKSWSDLRERFADLSAIDRPSMSMNVPPLNETMRRASGVSVANDAVRETSFWLTRQTINSMNPADSWPTDPQRQLLRLLEEVDSHIMELVGLEQQAQAISVMCKAIRESMVAKTNTMNKLIAELANKPKQMAQKETQTQTDQSDQPMDTTPEIENIDPRKKTLPVSKVPLVSSPKVHRVVRNRLSFTVQTLEPQGELSDTLKKSFGRLPALVKGYLTRRLMKADKVVQQIETIRGAVQVLDNKSDCGSPKDYSDKELERRLASHVKKSLQIIHDIFFKYTKAEQMAMVRNLRNAILEKNFKYGIPISDYSKSCKKTPPNSSIAKTGKVKKEMSKSVSGHRSLMKLPSKVKPKVEANRTTATPMGRPTTRSVAQRNAKKAQIK